MTDLDKAKRALKRLAEWPRNGRKVAQSFIAMRHHAALALEELGGKVLGKSTEQTLAELTTLRPQSEYHEDYGNVLWWHVPIQEPPVAGTTLDDGFDWDWYTHWSPLPNVKDPSR